MINIKNILYDVNKERGILVNYAYGSLLYLFIVWFEHLNAFFNPNYKVFLDINISSFSYKLYLFCFVFSFLGKHGRLFISSSIFAGLLFQGLNFTYFGNYIQAVNLYQIFFNFNEVVGVLFSGSLRLIGVMMALVTFAVTSVVVLNHFKDNNLQLRKLSYLVIIYMLLISYKSISSEMDDGDNKLWQYQARMILPSYEKSGIENLYIVVRGFVFVFLPRKMNTKDLFFELDAPVKAKTVSEHNIVLVIGESLRAKQLSLLGYEYPTTPKLSTIDRLIYNTIYSSGTMTKTSLPALLNRVKYPGASLQISNQENCLNKLAFQAGFDTHFISAQKSEDMDILQNLICKKYIENYKDRGDFYGAVTGFDEDLIPYLDVLSKNNQFLVLHMRGSHEPYSDRSPEIYKLFTSEYDNSILYTDFVVSSMISYIRNNVDKPTHFIFTSDHGELLGESGLNGHGWFKKEVVEVPFLYLGINTESKGRLEWRALSIKSHFQLSNFITNLLGYEISESDIDDEIYINGSDIDGLAGYIKRKNGVSDLQVLY